MCPAMAHAQIPEIKLTDSQERYCFFRANGETQTTAYAKSHHVTGLAAQTINNRANKLEKRAGIVERINTLVAEKKVSDVLSVGTALTDLLEDMKGAREAKNWTALATFHRLTLQVLGLLKENIVLTEEQRLPDDELIARIAAGNTEMGAALKSMLGSSDAFKETV